MHELGGDRRHLQALDPVRSPSAQSCMNFAASLSSLVRPKARRLPWLVAGLALLSAIAWLAHGSALERGRRQLHAAAGTRLEVEAARLDAQLSRFSYLPSLLETSGEVARLLGAPQDLALRETVNRHLFALNAIAGAENLYVLDRQGVAIAAADADQPGTPVGMNLSYRPYVQQALARGSGRFYGVGITSRRAGYYLSYALPANGDTRGLAVVKVNLASFEQQWVELPGEMLVLDEHQVVILASRQAWKYRPLEPLSDAARDEVARSRRYGDSNLAPLDWRWQPRPDGEGKLVRIDGSTLVAAEHALGQSPWRILLLIDDAPAQASARSAAVSAALASAVAMLLLIVAWQRRREIRARLASRDALQAAHDSLELKVAQRTAELRAAQNDLVHAGKLAVLGQMSAGLVHELNQPLAALHTLSDNAAVLVERGRFDEARGNLQRIGHMVARLGRLTSQLKVFAHKSEQAPVAVPVRVAVQGALTLLSVRLRDEAIEVETRVDPPDLAVLAEEVRLEQVLVNLIGNAVDAMSGGDVRRLEIVANARGEAAEIEVRNSGPGIDPAILPRLFEPFVTSKPPGKGLGLGLVISTHIVRGFGGNLRARNLSPAGVVFTVELPRALLHQELLPA